MDIKNYLVLLAAVIFLAGFAGNAIATDDLVVGDINVTPQFIAEAIAQAGGIVTGIEPRNMGPPIVNFQDSYGNNYFAVGWDDLAVYSEKRVLIKPLMPEDRCELYQWLLGATVVSSYRYGTVFNFWEGMTNATPWLSIEGDFPYDGTNSRNQMADFFRSYMNNARYHYQSSKLFAEYFGPMK